MPAFFVLKGPLAIVGPSYYPSTWHKLNAEANGFGRLDWSADVKCEEIDCPVNPDHFHLGARLTDLTAELGRARQIADFEWTHYGECMVTDRVRSLLQGWGGDGLDFRRAFIRVAPRRKSREVRLESVWELRPTGKGGPIHPKSGVRLVRICDHCGATNAPDVEHGFPVQVERWDGSDWFTLEEFPQIYMVTERVASLIVSNRLRNCQLVPAEDYHLYKTVPPPGA